MRNLVFFVNVSTFLRSSFPYRRKKPVPWTKWGPQNTRWFPENWATHRVRGSHGYRTADTVSCNPKDEYEFYDVKTTKLRVRDFNPNAVRRTAQGQIEKGWKCRAVMTPSTTLAKGTHKKDITSSLPYTEVISEETLHKRCSDG
jgi:hypothetical protein